MSMRLFVDKRGEPLMQHIQIKPIENSIRSTFDQGSMEGVYDITRKMAAQILDMQEKVIVDAVIECAQENGVDDLYLLDKKFVLDALREKIERDSASPFE